MLLLSCFSSTMTFFPGSRICGRANVWAKLFRNGAADFSITQPLHGQPWQSRSDLLQPEGEAKHPPSQCRPASSPPQLSPPEHTTGAEHHTHTLWWPTVAQHQVRLNNHRIIQHFIEFECIFWQSNTVLNIILILNIKTQKWVFTSNLSYK